MESQKELLFSWEEYCNKFPSHDGFMEKIQHESSRQFIHALNLPSVHPYCKDIFDKKSGSSGSSSNSNSNIPLMGPLLVYDHNEHYSDSFITTVCQVVPALYAMGELWLRLFASVLAPLCLSVLFWEELDLIRVVPSSKQQITGDKQNNYLVIVSIILGMASSVVLMTDTFYVLSYGPSYGALFVIASCILSIRAIMRMHQQQKQQKQQLQQKEQSSSSSSSSLRKPMLLFMYVAMMVILSIFLVVKIQRGQGIQFHFGGPMVPSEGNNIQKGLYYSTKNSRIEALVSEWPKQSRTYESVGLGGNTDAAATPWMPTGDSKTGLPFMLYHHVDPEYTRVFVPTFDGEVVALDICFPPETGHVLSSSKTSSTFMVLHGLSGGSNEEYIQDLIHRRTSEGHTVVVMIARGLMDLPIQKWNAFHGARVEDAHAAASVIQNALQKLTPSQGNNKKSLLIGAGYSMGAIILSNYVARYGEECQLDAAVAISGGLDMRHTLGFRRAMRLWQPLLVEQLRGTFVIEKLGEKYRARLTKKEMLGLLRAAHIAGVDEYAVVTYNGFDDLLHYYSEMSAMGDLPFEEIIPTAKTKTGRNPVNDDDDRISSSRIANVSIPLCVVHALDDPLIPWTTVASFDENSIRYPTNLVETGSGNLMLLLTKAGGHVGWPLGWYPTQHKWKWMSDVVKGFSDAVVNSHHHIQIPSTDE